MHTDSIPLSSLSRAVLLLEGLWDQLEATAMLAIAGSSDLPLDRRMRVRIAAYKVRLRDLAGRAPPGSTDGRVPAKILRATFMEVLDLLELLDDEVQANWAAILHRAQDAVLAALHELRCMSSDDRSVELTSGLQIA